MKATYMIENPGNIEATIKITMTVGQWEILQLQLSEMYPSCELSRAIRTLTADARRVIYAPEKKSIP